MKLPDDILSLIHEYSRPLKYREISNFWVEQGIINIEEMKVIALQEINECFMMNEDTSKIQVETYGNGTTCIFCLDNQHGNLYLSFDEKQLLEWVGDLKYLEEGFISDIYCLEKDDIMYKQLLNDTRVVKEKIIKKSKESMV